LICTDSRVEGKGRYGGDHERGCARQVSRQRPAPLPLFARWLRTRRMSARTRWLIDFLAARLAGEGP